MYNARRQKAQTYLHCKYSALWMRARKLPLFQNKKNQRKVIFLRTSSFVIDVGRFPDRFTLCVAMDIFRSVDIRNAKHEGSIHRMHPPHNRLHVFEGKLTPECKEDKAWKYIGAHPFASRVRDHIFTILTSRLKCAIVGSKIITKYL